VAEDARVARKGRIEEKRGKEGKAEETMAPRYAPDNVN